MDIPLCATCVVFFQNALKSPIGEAISSYINLFDPPLHDHYNILSVFDKLKHNEYASPEELLNSLSTVVDQSIRFFGFDSEISISLLALKQKIDLSIKPLLKGHQKIWEDSKNTLLNSLVSFCHQIPNDERSFRDFVNPENIVRLEPYVEPAKPSMLTIQTDKIDHNELKVLIQTLPKDEDNQFVRNIISHYEPEYAKSAGIVQIELKTLQPHTLRLLNDYAVKHAPPIPKPSLSSMNSPRGIFLSPTSSTQPRVNPASIPRMKSTPIPLSPDSKGILKTEIKTLHQSPSKIASQNLHQSLQSAATPQDIAKKLSLLSQNSKNNTLQVVTALTAMFKNVYANQQAAQKDMKSSNSAPSTPTVSNLKSKSPPANKVNQTELKEKETKTSNKENETKKQKEKIELKNENS